MLWKNCEHNESGLYGVIVELGLPRCDLILHSVQQDPDYDVSLLLL